MEKEKKYHWLATVSAPKEYPAEVYLGNLIADDFSYGFDAIWGTQNTGWGNQGGTMSVSTEQMEIPHTLEFTWLSLVEKKFYTGKWKLDKEKITALFEEGFMDYDTNKRATYDTFIIGLAPKGRVVLWASAAGIKKEVGVFQAHDTIITKEKAYENARYMLEKDYAEDIVNDPIYKTFKPETLEKIAKYGRSNPAVYDLYRERYNWKPVILLPEEGVWKSSTINFLNGELEILGVNEVLKNDFQSRAIPFYFVAFWKNKTTDSYGVWVDPFDEQEILNAFKKLGNKEDIELIFKVALNNESCRIFVKNKIEEIELKKAVITCE
ncbi:DUF2931 family protein [Flavobacterium sp. MMLR14_040]|uniref:DUF2931 family protein n=1 Tax=Flavobacterium sp. MMLR14_040 TaxID=3093843 RepID=UPI0029903614|nr:DUF2931 family protein [Flavobacterium sp. MMLR14_040]MDW8850034.1 DUF2931 family protein [Flavobacterium sp. MMLR14_040]